MLIDEERKVKMKNDTHFTAPAAESYGRIFYVAVAIFLCVLAIWLNPLWTIEEYATMHPDSVLDAKIMGVVALLGSTYMVFSYIIPVIVQFWSASYDVEILEDSIVGKNLWNQRTEIALSEIQSIMTAWTPPLYSLYPNVHIISFSGEKIIVHYCVQPLGRCIENIRLLSGNVEAVDYRGLDKKAKIWGVVE